MNARMWTAGIVTAMVAAASMVTPATARPSDQGDRPPIGDDWSGKWAGPGEAAGAPAATELLVEARAAAPAASTAGGADLMAAAGAVLVPCEDDEAFLCGTVPVPLDRRDPDGRMVNLHVEVFPHTGPQEQADGAVFVTCGGPGCSVTTVGAKYGFSFFVLPQIAETRDLVYVDQRGVGLSDVIDCPELQAGGPLYESAAACHDQLGDAANLYSTTDVADDLEDVRQALGYAQIDLFGGSYAGADMMTYAVRHTDHVRSVVLASPVVVVGTDPFYPYAPEAMAGVVAGLCGSSPACAARHPKPARDFAWLARQLRRHPVSGVGVDSTGSTHDMTVTENIVSNFIMYNAGGGFVGPGEITPAAAAARRGDLVPLLRLAADVDPAAFAGDELPFFSAGHALARSCVDGVMAFDKSAPADVREAQFAAALAAEPDLYGVISKEAWAAPGYLGFAPPPCIASVWEDRPLYPAGTQVDGVPTLVLGGEYDLPVPESVSQLATEVLTDSTYVSMSAAGHDPQFWSDCGPELVQRFIADLDVGDTSCADQPAGGWWVPGSFLKRANQAPPAEQASGKRASRRTRRLVTAAAWTVMDSLRHNFTVPDDSVALRGGIVDWEPIDDESAQWTLADARFTKDITVNGTIIGTFPLFDGEITVDGLRRHDTTTMHFSGEFFVPGADITMTTTVRGKAATFTLPAY